jgi:hypothetical protein
MSDRRKHARFQELSTQELEAEERLEEDLAEKEDVRRFDAGFAEYERARSDHQLEATEADEGGHS